MSNLLMNMPSFGKFSSLLKREFYEHKTGFVLVPTVIGALFLLFAIGGLITGSGEIISISGAQLSLGEVLSMKAAGVDQEAIKRGMSAAMMAVGATVLFILPFVVFFSLLNSLYEERVERSYLFWKSMPVSDLQEVLSKLVFIVFLGPVVLFTFAAVLSVATMILFTPFLLINEVPLVGVLWSQTPFISGWIGVAATYMVWALWALPIFGWILLASAYAPKAPLMFVIVPPIVLMLAEKMFFGTEWFDKVVSGRLGERFGDTVNASIDMQRFKEGDVNFLSPTFGEAMQVLGNTLISPSFWMGTAVAAAFVMGAVYLRRYKI